MKVGLPKNGSHKQAQMETQIKMSHEQKAEHAKMMIKGYMAEREEIKKQLGEQLKIINAKTPKTIRKAQKRFKELRNELLANIYITDSYRNGGIW